MSTVLRRYLPQQASLVPQLRLAMSGQRLPALLHQGRLLSAMSSQRKTERFTYVLRPALSDLEQLSRKLADRSIPLTQTSSLSDLGLLAY